MKIFKVLLITLMLLANTAFAAEFSAQLKTSEGIVQGVYDEKYNVVKWFGIPYAQQANGEKRWALPQRAEKYAGVKDCSQYAPANLQFNGKNVIGQEGVLTLDVYRPDSVEKNLPVLVFIHGGNNQTSNSRLWMGEKFAKEANAVYVSVQYRLGLLGFNNLPALANSNALNDSGNYGLIDQAYALEWIKKNIDKFGGDANNITVSGFSAGGRDVMAMLISPLFKDKFDKAISFSGGLTVADFAESQKIIAGKLAPLVVADGICADEKDAAEWLMQGSKEVRSYLMKLPGERLAPVMAGALIRMKSFPHLYGDGKVLPKEGFAAEKFNSVPLLMLASSDEFTSFLARDPYFKNRMDKVLKDKLTTEEFVFANKYGSKFYGFFNGQESAEDIYANYKAPIYVCMFDFGHDPAVVGETYAVKTGATHGIFLPFLTDQPYPYTVGTDVFAKPGPQELSDIFIASLAAFIRTGDPNNALLLEKWEAWTPQNRAETVFDADGKQAKVYQRSNDTSYDGILEELEADNSLNADSKNYIIKNILNGRWFSGGLDAKYHNKN